MTLPVIKGGLMDSRIYFRIFFDCFIAIVLIIITTACIIGKVSFVNKDKELPPVIKEFNEKHAGKINFTMKSLLVAGSIILLLLKIIPTIRDIPYMKNQQYNSIQGVALSQDITKSSRIRNIKIKDNSTDDTIHVQFYSGEHIYIGDYLEVFYLPHNKMGTLYRLTHN